MHKNSAKRVILAKAYSISLAKYLVAVLDQYCLIVSDKYCQPQSAVYLLTLKLIQTLAHEIMII